MNLLTSCLLVLSAVIPNVDDTPYSIVWDNGPEPVIHAPHITGATPGRPFLFRIPATGEGPLTFIANGLPKGLCLNADTGIITGALENPGNFYVTLSVNGPKGKTKSTLCIVGGDHKLALTPPMGWNTWFAFSVAIDDAKIRAAADALVSTGLAAHGYQYICIDDCWQDRRGKDGRTRPTKRFPDMKALADYIHAKGLKFGIYSSPGPKTCAGYTGSMGYEEKDAETYAEWGVDFLKYDWCSYGSIAKSEALDELQRPYRVMREALDACNRDIVYSLCQYGKGDVWKWGTEVGGNLWRTTGDIGVPTGDAATWDSVVAIANVQAGKESFVSPGHWNDPDMLVLGSGGGLANASTESLFTMDEQIAYVSYWSLLAAPLLLSSDLTHIDKTTLAILTNDEVLEVNQDRLGHQAKRLIKDAAGEVWVKPLSDGTLAVGLFNLGSVKQSRTITWAELGIQGEQPVRDLWRHQSRGMISEAFTASPPSHGVVLVKIGKPKRMK